MNRRTRMKRRIINVLLALLSTIVSPHGAKRRPDEGAVSRLLPAKGTGTLQWLSGTVRS